MIDDDMIITQSHKSTSLMKGTDKDTERRLEGFVFSFVSENEVTKHETAKNSG